MSSWDPGPVHGLTRENLVATLPVALQKDPSAVALAEAMAELLARRPDEIEQLRIYPVIDRLDEQLLDILAYDFKVDWWDADYSLEEKRQTLKDSWRVHKLLGTKAAVVMAISAIYPRTQVLEWWEYGGEPYHFRLDINITNDSIDSAKQRRVLERLNFYKSLRSHNDGVTYFVEAAPAISKAVSSVSGLEETAHIPLVVPVPIIKPTASARVGVITGLWETFASAVELTTPPIQSVVCARARASAGWQETFVARVTLPSGDPPCGTAGVRVTASGMWQESYTTRAVPLTEKVLTVTAQAEAGSGVALTQETAKTHIDLRR